VLAQPELVERDDIMQFSMDGTVAGADNRPAYLERFIYAAIFAARPDVHAIVHGHPKRVLPFTISDVKLRPVFLTADEIGMDIPTWDIRDRFGDTNMLIANMDHGRDLAASLGSNKVILIRGHGFVGATRSAMALVRLAKALLDNAEMQLEAMRLGPIKELTAGEIAARERTLGKDDAPATIRGWEYEAIQAGCRPLLDERAKLAKAVHS
jgi:HCOMODA/2-hydroxy-3-carboxy-muconic semialdehyde decarboxylase